MPKYIERRKYFKFLSWNTELFHYAIHLEGGKERNWIKFSQWSQTQVETLLLMHLHDIRNRLLYTFRLALIEFNMLWIKWWSIMAGLLIINFRKRKKILMHCLSIPILISSSRISIDSWLSQLPPTNTENKDGFREI